MGELTDNFYWFSKESSTGIYYWSFHNNNPASLFRPIPITKQEATAQEMKQICPEQKLFWSPWTDEQECSERYGRIKSKRHGEILEEVRFLFNSEIENEFEKPE